MSLEDIEGRIRSFLETLPNIPDPDVPAGAGCNQAMTVWGTQPSFDFKPRDHGVGDKAWT